MRYDKFTGVNLSSAPHLLQEGECRDLRNMQADRLELRKRAGAEVVRFFTFAHSFMFLPTAIYDLPFAYRPSTDAHSVFGRGEDDWGALCAAFTLDPDEESDIPDHAWDNWPDMDRQEPDASDTVLINASVAITETLQTTPFLLTLTAMLDGAVDTSFTGGADVTLGNTFYTNDALDDVEQYVLSPIDMSVGWSNGVWRQNVVIASLNTYDRLWIGAVYEKNYGTMLRLKVTQ